jgi:hypothetical protein
MNSMFVFFEITIVGFRRGLEEEIAPAPPRNLRTRACLETTSILAFLSAT